MGGTGGQAWRVGGTLLFFLLPVGHVHASSNPITPVREFSAVLPSGEGKILVLKYCVACHGPRVARARLEAGKWMSEQWGAIMESGDTEPLAQYLEENFGEDSQQPPPEEKNRLEALLPPGGEKNLILGKCIGCHQERVLARRLESRRGLPAQVWKQVLSRMKSYGAPLTEDEIGPLSAYLESCLGSDTQRTEPSPAGELYSFLPAGAGKDLIAAQCLACHGASELKNRIEKHPPEDPNYWEAVVRRMKDRWEATLEEEEVTAVVAYLNSRFAR